MRLYLQQLRRIQYPSSADRPGPVGPSSIPCEGLHFGIDKGCWRFRTSSALVAFFTRQHDMAPLQFSHPLTCEPIPASAYTPLVFAHHNLTPKNILLDDHGVVWLINWSRAGFYPSWSEYLGIQFGADIYSHTKSWKYCVKYMTQPDFQVEKCMREMGFCTTGYLIWDRSRQSTLYILVQGPVQMLSIHLLVAHSTFKDQ